MTSIQSLHESLVQAIQKTYPNSDLVSISEQATRDVERAMQEPLQILPICHFSPASAIAVRQFLELHKPKAIYLELTEDLNPLIQAVPECVPPFTLQAIAQESTSLDSKLLPVKLNTSLVEASAEFQAIQYAAKNKQVHLVLVDSSCDFATHHSRQRLTHDQEAPMLQTFLTALLGQVEIQNFWSWWTQYFEVPLQQATLETYRQTLTWIGSLFRQLGYSAEIEADNCDRERYMWTRIKQHLNQFNIDPCEALYICGASHAATPVVEFGSQSQAMWTIPAPSTTRWQYGLMPTSFSDIEESFNIAPGTLVSLEMLWQANRQTKGGRKRNPTAKTSRTTTDLFITAPAPPPLNEIELASWCTGIVKASLKHGYLASTADAIAIFEHTLLLSGLRNHPTPLPNDFIEASVTCLDKNKTQTPSITTLCHRILAADRCGSIGYKALPAVAQDVIDRLAPLGFNFAEKKVRRALLNFNVQPTWLECSQLLWRLHYLGGDELAKPIMGACKLGVVPTQESWDIYVGKNQKSLIKLGYEGITVEEIIEKRLLKITQNTNASTVDVLNTIFDSLLYLHNPHLTETLGNFADQQFITNSAVGEASKVFEKTRYLIQFYRSQSTAIPQWILNFIGTGFQYYCQRLPATCTEKEAASKELCAMLNFLIQLEGFATSAGLNAQQFDLSLNQCQQLVADPAKTAIIHAACILRSQMTEQSVREAATLRRTSSVLISTFPLYVAGLVESLSFAPFLANLAGDLLNSFFTMPDTVLIPWLPALVLKLQEMPDLLKLLVEPVIPTLPQSLSQLDQWNGLLAGVPLTTAISPTENASWEFIREFPSCFEYFAAQAGCPVEWAN
ncbi:DUF5682 family protein [Leptolyngbya sp. AN03gr2]|uniref:DUF5682 family protein n=1 Tax=unclassified Leptolyngbya TaxID=2650499 RepID=UPI003D312974